MSVRIYALIAAASFLILLSGCDNYSLLDGFDRSGGLSLDVASPSLEQGGTTALYAAGGKPPYSWMLIEKDLAYLDSADKLGTITGTTYTAGNSIGAVTVRIRDGMGNTKDADITVLPPPPTGLTVTPGGVNSLILDWSFAHPEYISGFAVYRCKAGVPFAEVTTLGSGAIHFSNSPLSPNTEYTYYLQAFNGPYRSRPTAQISRKTD